jgi:hypothetical protein
MLKFSWLGTYEKRGILACFCEGMSASSASTLFAIK